MSLEKKWDTTSPIVCGVLTISDTRDVQTDRGGQHIREALTIEGYHIQQSAICMDDAEAIQEIVERWAADSNIDVVITTGGTGIAVRDITVETISPYFTKTIDGFGELFRYISYAEDVGSKAMLSRAAAGAIGEQVWFLLPGSVKAVDLAMRKLILPEVRHIVYELTKHRNR